MSTTRTDFLATGAETGGAFCLVDETAVQGETVPLHRHPDDIESFYVIAGELSFSLGDLGLRRATAGDFVHLPGGVVHGFRVVSETARYLILTTPRHGDFYRAISFAAQPDGSRPASDVTEDTIMKACAEFGIEFVGPFPEAST